MIKTSRDYKAMIYPPHLRQQRSSDFCALSVDLNQSPDLNCRYRAVQVIPAPLSGRVVAMPGKKALAETALVTNEIMAAIL